MGYLKVVKRLIDELNIKKIVYCHWKSNEHVSDAFRGIDDIDMLVSKDDILKLNIVLNELQFKRFILPPERTYIGIEDYIGFDEEKGVFVHLHLHYQLTLGEKFLKGYQIPFEVEILKRRIFDNVNNIYTSSYEDELWLLILRLTLKLRTRDSIKYFLNKDIFGESTVREFEWLKTRIDKDVFKRICDEIFTLKLSNKILEMASQELNFKNILKLQNELINYVRLYKTYGLIESNLKRWNREYFRVCQLLNSKIYKSAKSYRRTPISGGKIIAFLGPDGAGKTTIIKETYSKLEKFMDVNKVYLGSGDGNSSILRIPMKIIYKLIIKLGILNRKSKRIDKFGSVYREEEIKIGQIIRKIGMLPWVFALSKERKSKLIKANKFKSRGFIVLTDRYPQTQIIDMCDGPKNFLNKNIQKNFINNKLYRIEKESFEIAEVIKPDITIILKVSSEVAYNRKPNEVDIETHKKIMEAILSIDFGINTKKIIINADGKIDDVIVEVMNAIWRNI